MFMGYQSNSIYPVQEGKCLYCNGNQSRIYDVI